MDTETAQPAADVVDFGTILLLRDMERVFKTSRTTILKRLADGTFPVAPLPKIDAKLRWWGPAVRSWLEANGQPTSPRERRS